MSAQVLAGVRQHTIGKSVSCEGVGVHSGQVAHVRLSPAGEDGGICFVRTDLKTGDSRIPARAALVSATELGTSLKNASGAEAATVEHLLSACAGLGIDNLTVEMDGPELPILDGSALGFVELLRGAELHAQDAPRRGLRILEKVEIADGQKWAHLAPLEGEEAPLLDVTINFSDPAIGVQRRVFSMGAQNYLAEIAGARTFGFMADVEKMRAAGLGRGASLDNAVVIDEGRVINPGGLRYEDEFVRHKILDAIGDLALVGGPILGHYAAERPGHTLNIALIRALLQRPQAWAWVPIAEQDGSGKAH